MTTSLSVAGRSGAEGFIPGYAQEVGPVTNERGGYLYVPGIAPYSAGVLADEDHVIVRVTLGQPVPWLDGFTLIDRVLADEGRLPQALCAVELRCNTPHSFNGFGSFNDEYRQALATRDILFEDGSNPVARTNVAPAVGREVADETELHAFSYTAAAAGHRSVDSPSRASFVIAGAGDLNDQADLRAEAIVGGATPWTESGSARAAAVLDEMETRLAAFDLTWADSDSVTVYSVERIGAVMESTVIPRLGDTARNGIHWYHARPPITGLLFEMDTRGGVIERRI